MSNESDHLARLFEEAKRNYRDLDSRIAVAVRILSQGLERHRDTGTGDMCECGGCQAMHRAIRALKGDSAPAEKGGET